jgi:hypothetical protein
VAKRKAVSTRTRFEVFKRDGFRCVYCGAAPTAGPLHVDHVEAVANGGTSSPANLVTACADCNLGKSSVPLEDKRIAKAIATTADRDHARQILEYLSIQRGVEAAKSQAADVVAERWEEIVGPLSQVMYDRLSGLLAKWSIEDLEEAMQITGRKLSTVGERFDGYDAQEQTKYFHGVLRRWDYVATLAGFFSQHGISEADLLRALGRPRLKDIRMVEMDKMASAVTEAASGEYDDPGDYLVGWMETL